MTKEFNQNAIATILKLCSWFALFFIFNTLPILAANLVNIEWECQPDIIKVTSGVYVAVGNTRANIIFIEGNNEVIAVDTGDSIDSANRVLSQFRQISRKPIKTVIYTHSHYDHIGGTRAFIKSDRINIYARDNFKIISTDKQWQNIHSTRWPFQQGTFTSPEEIQSLNPIWCQLPFGAISDGFIPPNHQFSEEKITLNIAGLTLELIAAPGESDDQLYVWLPEQKVLLCGDNFYRSFPYLSSLRGYYQDPQQWILSLDKILTLQPKYLISGHALPISGSQKIKQTIRNYRNSIASIFEQTLAGMNRGLTPDELVQIVKLPPELAKKPYLQENFGSISWTVRGIYSHYLGWFDGNPTHLFPLSPLDNALHIARLTGGKEQLWQATREAFEDGDDRWVLQLTDYLMTLEFRTEAVKKLRVKTLKRLAKKQDNGNAKHYYLSSAEQLK
ncbi:MAG: alkyl/aryl-sulfatase [Cyanobacteria bacterium SBLK]|nr:alkyl/aryl-sulfatase [Cyanobacteria bacterium SBLK]